MIVVIAMFSCCRNYSSCLISQSKENWLYTFSFSIRRHYRVWQHPWGLHLYQRFVGAWSEGTTYSSRSPSILVFTICTLFRIRHTLREWCCQKTTCWCWSVLLFSFQFFNSLSFVISYLCIIYFSFFFFSILFTQILIFVKKNAFTLWPFWKAFSPTKCACLLLFLLFLLF